jgi:hypothetical protein
MNEISGHQHVEPGSARHLERMLRESKASAGPALLLAAACLAITGILIWSAILG